MTTMKLTRAEVPATRAECIQKWRNDAGFRARAELMGFKVVFDNVILPTGKVADKRVK
jgi:hypothetical protein